MVTFQGDITAANLLVDDVVEFTTGSETYETTVVEINLAANKIKCRGQNVAYLTDTSTFTNPTLSSVGVDRVTEVSDATFVPETNNDGSVFSKWISRLFLFESPSDGVEIKLACVLYDINDVKVYYRPKPLGYDGELTEINWIPFNGTGLADNSEVIKPRSSNEVNPLVLKSGDWQSLTFSVQDIPSFDGLQVKIVMSSDNPAKAPLIDDMQLVTSE